MVIALYGGSFNPPHVGHAMVASWVRWTREADAVWWAPSFSHPFAKDLAPFERRLGMVQAVVEELGVGHRACAIEAELPTPSYTVDVLDALSARHPEDRFRIVIGADNLPDLHKWKAPDRLMSKYDPIVVGRDGYDNPSGTVVFPGVSSTEIRQLCAAGRAIRHLVTACVADEAEALYSVRREGPKPTQP